MERFPQLLFVQTAREDSHLVASAFCFLDQRHRQRHPPTATPACLLTLKPALPAVVFPALLRAFLTGANNVQHTAKHPQLLMDCRWLEAVFLNHPGSVLICTCA